MPEEANSTSNAGSWMVRHRGSAEHYTWGQGCDGWHLVQSAELSVIEESMPPASCEVRHFHKRARQFFYVLEGALTLEVDERSVVLGPGEGIEIEPGQRHQAINRSPESLRMLVISQPPSHKDRFLD